MPFQSTEQFHEDWNKLKTTGSKEMYFFMASSSKKFWMIRHQMKIYFILQGDYEWCYDLWGKQHEVTHKRKKSRRIKEKEIHTKDSMVALIFGHVHGPAS